MKRRGVAFISLELLQQVLHLPEGVEIIGIESQPARDCERAVLVLAGTNAILPIHKENTDYQPVQLKFEYCDLVQEEANRSVKSFLERPVLDEEEN